MKNKRKTSIMVVVLLTIISIVLYKPVLNNINFGIDLQGGFEVLYKVEPLVSGEKLNDSDLDKTYKAIVNRIDSLGVSEPVISFEGSDLLRIQLPGVNNEEEARERISTTAVLTFRDVDDNLLMTSSILGRGGASLSTDPQTMMPVVNLDISDTDKFYEVTKKVSTYENDRNRMVIWLDYDDEKDSFESVKDICGRKSGISCISSPYVNSALLENTVVISGGFTQEEAQKLVDLINAGSLPTRLIEESTPKSVSPSFGSNTINKAAISGIIAIVIIIGILIYKYRISGLISGICLITYSLLVFVLFNAVGGVLTLTGVAALILGIGMAVDSSIISIERIKDELLLKKKLAVAVKDGNKNSFVSIIDANITTLIAGVVLYVFGESSVKGFATMLIITIIVTVFTMVFVNRFLLGMFVHNNAFNNREEVFVGKLKSKKKFNFYKKSKYFYIVSGIIITIGIIFGFISKPNYGIDFVGGTYISMNSHMCINFNAVEEIFKDYEIVEMESYFGTQDSGYIKIKENLNKDEEIIIKEKLSELDIETSLNEISTLVTKNLTKNAGMALIYVSIAIILYVAIRFSMSFSISGVIMLFHDVLIVLSVFMIFNIEINFILVAALLTIIGYSINDTIVVFDRIRDNKKKYYKDKALEEKDLIDLVNMSSNESLGRNIWTTVTTLMAVIILLIMNVNEIFTFNIAVFIGLVAGCMSSSVLAARLWVILEKWRIKHPSEEINDELDEKDIKGINS